MLKKKDYEHFLVNGVLAFRMISIRHLTYLHLLQLLFWLGEFFF